MHMTGSAPAPPPIDFNDPLQYQVMQANRWSQERQLEEQRSHIVFGGPEDVVPKASVPTRWSQKITETSHTFRGPDTFSQQELAYEHAHRHSTRGGRIYMPPSQLTIKEGGYVPAKEQRLSRMPAPDDLSQKDRVRALMTDDMPQPLDEKYYYDHMGAVKPWDREKMSHRPTQAADQLRWDGRYSPPTLPKKHAGGTGAGSSAHKSVVDELAFGHDVDYSMGIPYHLDRAKQSEGRRRAARPPWLRLPAPAPAPASA